MNHVMKNHYDWLMEYLPTIFFRVGLDSDQARGAISAHGDKAYMYRDVWESKGIPFEHGVALYILSYFKPFSKEVREVEEEWVDPCIWVYENYSRFERFIPSIYYVVQRDGKYLHLLKNSGFQFKLGFENAYKYPTLKQAQGATREEQDRVIQVRQVRTVI